MPGLKLKDICGQASDEGFILEAIFKKCGCDWPIIIDAKTAFYDKQVFDKICQQKIKEQKLSFKTKLGALGALILIIGIGIFSYLRLPHYSLHPLLAVSILLFALFYSAFLSASVTSSITGLYIVSGWQSVKEWHGAEHKTIHLIQKHFKEGTELNLENLKAMNRFDAKCGTTSNSVSIGRYICFCAALLVAPFLFIHYSILFILLSLLVFPRLLAFFMSYILQSFITTAEPAEEKLIAGLEVAKEIIEKAKFIDEHTHQT